MTPGSKHLLRPALFAASALLVAFSTGCGQRQAPKEPPIEPVPSGAPAQKIAQGVPAPPLAPEPAPAPSPAPSPKAVPAPKADGPKIREPADLAKAGETVKAWLKAIESQDEGAAHGALITEKEVEGIVTEGIRHILVGSLLPLNRSFLDALLRSAKGKELNFIEWTPGRISRTMSGSSYLEGVRLLDRSRLEFLLGDETVDLGIDMVEIDGRWKILKLDPRQEEGEEEGGD